LVSATHTVYKRQRGELRNGLIALLDSLPADLFADPLDLLVETSNPESSVRASLAFGEGGQMCAGVGDLFQDVQAVAAPISPQCADRGKKSGPALGAVILGSCQWASPTEVAVALGSAPGRFDRPTTGATCLGLLGNGVGLGCEPLLHQVQGDGLADLDGHFLDVGELGTQGTPSGP